METIKTHKPRVYVAKFKDKRVSATSTPRQAAVAFFAAYPTARKVNVSEFEVDGQMLTQTFMLRAGMGGAGDEFRNWWGISKPEALALPDVPWAPPVAAPVQAVA